MFHRLIAFELLASPEVTQFNHALVTTTGQLYLEQRDGSLYFASSERGQGIVRAPLLEAVRVFLEAYETNSWDPLHLARKLAQEHAQTRCCWYSFGKKKACPADAVQLSTQEQPYVFCRKHWSPILRNEIGVDHGLIVPPSEAKMDDWLQTIV